MRINAHLRASRMFGCALHVAHHLENSRLLAMRQPAKSIQLIHALAAELNRITALAGAK